MHGYKGDAGKHTHNMERHNNITKQRVFDQYKSNILQILTLFQTGFTFCNLVAVSMILECRLMCNSYTIILLKSVAVSKLQVAILAQLSREMSRTVRIDRQYEFASPFGLAIFYTRE